MRALSGLFTVMNCICISFWSLCCFPTQLASRWLSCTNFLKWQSYIYIYIRSAFPSPAVQCNYKHHSNRSKWFFVLELLSFVDDHIFGVFWGKNKQMKKQACPVPLSWVVKNMSLSAMVWLTDVLKQFSDNSLGQSAKLGLGCTGTSCWHAEYIGKHLF